MEFEEKYKYFDKISLEEIKNFTAYALSEYGSEEKLAKANKVAAVVIDLLKEKGLLNENANQVFVDVLIASCLMHNLFIEKNNWVSLFYARKTLEDKAEDFGVTKNLSDAVFQTIEAQMWDASPVPLIKPSPNTPTELLAIAVWIVNNIENNTWS